MSTEVELLPISALQHFVFCPRQCALIHLEQQWKENQFTAEGRVFHERADRPEHEMRDGVRKEFTVELSSSRLGLIGKADVVEFYKDGTCCPVEYKRGRPKMDHCDEIQLCAQALCLEEKLGIAIAEGIIFYGKTRRRHVVAFSSELRMETDLIAKRLHQLISQEKTPPAKYEPKKCDTCSLKEICMPKNNRSVEVYIRESLTSDYQTVP